VGAAPSSHVGEDLTRGDQEANLRKDTAPGDFRPSMTGHGRSLPVGGAAAVVCL
jgi:hypothetical protein